MCGCAPIRTSDMFAGDWIWQFDGGYREGIAVHRYISVTTNTLCASVGSSRLICIHLLHCSSRSPMNQTSRHLLILKCRSGVED